LQEDDADSDGEDGGLAAFMATDAETFVSYQKISTVIKPPLSHKRLKPLATTTEPVTKFLVRLFCGRYFPASATTTSCGTSR
jgi:hypothetical protein